MSKWSSSCVSEQQKKARNYFKGHPAAPRFRRLPNKGTIMQKAKPASLAQLLSAHRKLEPMPRKGKSWENNKLFPNTYFSPLCHASAIWNFEQGTEPELLLLLLHRETFQERERGKAEQTDRHTDKQGENSCEFQAKLSTYYYLLVHSWLIGWLALTRSGETGKA